MLSRKANAERDPSQWIITTFHPQVGAGWALVVALRVWAVRAGQRILTAFHPQVGAGLRWGLGLGVRLPGAPHAGACAG